jgi:hypothetical protein
LSWHNHTFSGSNVLSSGFRLFAVCEYGGYFNGGLRILLLVVFGLMGQTNIHVMNGLKLENRRRK